MAQAAGPWHRGPSRASWRSPSNGLAMGNRTARNTGVSGTGVEAIGDKEKMIDLNESPLVKLDRIQREAEARGYRRGVEDAAKNVPTNWLDSLLTGPNGIGQGPYDGRHIEKLMRGTRAAILALLEQTSDSNSPYLPHGTGNEKKI
jgi:hypothetical protein